MNFIRNLLALIGIIALGAGGYLYSQYGSMLTSAKADLAVLDSFDPKAKTMYLGMWDKLKTSGVGAEATVWKYPLAEGVSPADAEEAMKFIANEHNIKAVGELPLSEQVQLMTGKEQRFLKIYQYCDPLTAMKMVEYSDAFAAYLPCRIAMVQDKSGKYNLYSLDMDLMIHGGKTLPPELKTEAERVKKIMLDIMERGAKGEF